MKKLLTLTLLASTLGACKSTQKVKTNKNQEIKKETKKLTKKVKKTKKD